MHQARREPAGTHGGGWRASAARGAARARNGSSRGFWRRVAGSFAAVALTMLAEGALAASWTVNGLTFSDERGGVRLLEVRGSGSRDDPIVLVEEITGADAGTLTIRNHRGRPQRSPGVGGYLLLSIVKIVTNRGPWRWSGFDLELRSAAGLPSVYTDGLSFDQPQAIHRPARADRFVNSVQEDEPFDRIRFDGGSVDPADRVQLRFDVVDVNAARVFHLVQRPIVLMAQRHPRSETGLALATTATTPKRPSRQDPRPPPRTPSGSGSSRRISLPTP